MKQIKVVHLCNIDVGLKIHLGNYMCYQRDQGYEVSAITHPGNWIKHDTTIPGGIFVKVIPFEPRICPLNDLKTLRRLIRYFREAKFDIVHTHTVKPGLLGRLAARLVGVPVIVHTIHGFFFYEGMAKSQYRIFTMVEKLGAACSHLLLSQNCQDIETALQEKICPPEKIRHLGNGVNLERFDPGKIQPEKIAALRSELGIPPNLPVIGFAARFEREKGVNEFFEAIHLLKTRGIEFRCLMIGASQPHKNSFISPQELVTRYGMENEVNLLGFRDDIPELLALMDLVILPSHGREGIPRILMESAAMGKPVVATRVRGIVEAVEDGRTGMLVPVKDGPALAEGIQSLLSDSVLAAEMSRRARAHALSHFDERHFFRVTDLEYRRLLKTNLGIDSNTILRPVETIYHT